MANPLLLPCRIFPSSSSSSSPIPPSPLSHSSTSSTGSSFTSTTTPCLICRASTSRYICPQCNIPYCSVACFKAHDTKCTEKFYRSHVESNCNVTTCSQPSATIVKALKTPPEPWDASTLRAYLRLHSLASLSEEDLSLEMLTKEERERFFRAVSNGLLSRIVQVYNPWWLTQKVDEKIVNPTLNVKRPRCCGGFDCNGKIVVAVSSSPTTTCSFISCIHNCPPSNLPPPLSLLSSRPPSPLLPYHLLEILYTFAFVLRHFNGIEEMKLANSFCEAAGFLLTISNVLSGKQSNYVCCSTVGRSFFNTLQLLGHAVTEKIIISDALHILKGPHFIFDVLIQTSETLRMAREEIQQEKQTKRQRRALRQFNIAQKKVNYFIAWTKAWCNDELKHVSLQNLSDAVLERINKM